MTIEELIDLQEAGARARVLGLAGHENPFLGGDRLPSKTDDDLADWVARHDAWKFGWEAENAIRDGAVIPLIRSQIPTKVSRP